MPYITKSRRDAFEPALKPLLDAMTKAGDKLTKGDVTYLITKLLVRYVKVKEKSYDSLSNVDGILGTASKEFYAVVTRPYEARKQLENDLTREIYGEIQ
jgi:hypothetical protein